MRLPRAAAVVLFATLCTRAPALAQQDAVRPAVAQHATSGFVLEVGDHSLTELIEHAAKFLGRNILVGPQELAAAGGGAGVSLQQRIDLDVPGCEDLLSSLLYARGFALVPLDEPRGFWEVIAISGSRGREIMNRALPRTPEQILARPALRIAVTTVVTLKHVNATIAVNSLRPFFASGGQQNPGLALGSVGNGQAMLLTGFADQVAAAIRMIREADLPPSAPDADTQSRLQLLEQRVQALEAALLQQQKHADKQ